MRNSQNRNNINKIFISWPFLFVLGLFILFFIWGVIGFMGKMSSTRKNRQIAEDKVAELSEAKARLEIDIATLQTDKGKEASIRDKFGFVKEGEGLIVVVDEKVEPVEVEDTKGFFSFFKNWFK